MAQKKSQPQRLTEDVLEQIAGIKAFGNWSRSF
ncbi:XyeA family cyclophane-containing RiPP triceptide [Yersinia rochesterensis]|nr:XyeA family cyclophane-containing RiPP triceptide [Yersinia rochesterensis]